MPVDPKKMEAWLRPTDEDEEETSGEQPVQEDEPESEEEAAAEGTIEERYPTLFPLLEENGREVEEAADVLDPDMVVDQDATFEGEEQGMLQSACDSLPEDVRAALQSEGADLTWEDAAEIADALVAGDHIEDPERFAGFLFHVRKCLSE